MLPRRIFSALLVIALCLITIYSLRLRRDPSHVADRPFSSLWPAASPPKDQDFIPQSDLRRLCDQTAWTDGLWLQCHGNGRNKTMYGGLNNVRNRLQTCLRLAIDAGSGLIISQIATRNEEALKDLGGGDFLSATAFWNMGFLESSMKSQCPQLQLRYDGDLSGINTILNAPKRHYRHAPHYNKSFQELKASVLAKGKVDVTQITPKNPVAIAFGDSFIGWDYAKAGELSTVRKDLFKTIIYNSDLLDISSKILRSPQLKEGFIGIHLRGERDWPSSFGRVDRQMRLYTEEMEKLERKSPSELRTVYVSCGNKTAIQIFRDKLTPLGYEVHDKWSLLADDSETLEQVEDLIFDLKGAVEYQMLLNADFFLGPAMSSMTSLIAYARSVNETENFFPTYIFPGSEKNTTGTDLRRTYPETPIMKGNSRTKLMIVNGDDIMSAFP